MKSQAFSYREVECVIVSKKEDDGQWSWVYKFDHHPLTWAAHDERYGTEDEALEAARPLVTKDVDDYLDALGSGRFLEFLQERRPHRS